MYNFDLFVCCNKCISSFSIYTVNKGYPGQISFAGSIFIFDAVHKSKNSFKEQNPDSIIFHNFTNRTLFEFNNTNHNLLLI